MCRAIAERYDWLFRVTTLRVSFGEKRGAARDSFHISPWRARIIRLTKPKSWWRYRISPLREHWPRAYGMEAGWNRTLAPARTQASSQRRDILVKRLARTAKPRPRMSSGERLTDANRYLIVSGPMLTRLPAETRFNPEA